MDPQPYSREYSFEEGFFPSQDQYDGVAGTAFDGLGYWLRGRRMKVDRGAVGIGSTGGAKPLMVAAGALAGMSGGLGVVLSHLGVYWFAGSGSALVSGSPIGTSAGKLYLVVGGIPFAAGLTAPTYPTTFAAVSPTASGIMGGSYAIALCKFRQTTGAVSSRGPISVPVVATKKMIRLTMPPNPGDGTTHWLVYATRRNFAGLGVVFRATNISQIAVSVTTQDIEYQDVDLGDAAPLTNAPAPDCTHCAVLGGVMVAISGGGMCYPSHPGFPEAYDLGLAVRLPSGEAPTCVIPQGVEGGVFVGTRNSIGILVLSGSSDVPVLPRGVFAHTGVAHGNALCWAMNQLWGFSSTGNPFRTQGGDVPDQSFAEPVMSYFEDNNFTGDTTSVIYDEKNGAVLFCSGGVAVPYMLASGRWSTPIPLPGTVTAGIAFNGAAAVTIGAAAYNLNSGAGPSGSPFMRSPHYGADGHIITMEGFRAISPDACTLDVLPDLGTASVGGYFPATFTPPHGNPKVLKTNRKFRSAALKVSQSAGGAKFNKAFIEGSVEPGNH